MANKVNYQKNVHHRAPKTNFRLGANDGSAAGVGGMQRRKKIDSIVDEAVNGTSKKKR
jgi:hypothetical protein